MLGTGQGETGDSPSRRIDLSAFDAVEVWRSTECLRLPLPLWRAEQFDASEDRGLSHKRIPKGSPKGIPVVVDHNRANAHNRSKRVLLAKRVLRRAGHVGYSHGYSTIKTEDREEPS